MSYLKEVAAYFRRLISWFFSHGDETVKLCKGLDTRSECKPYVIYNPEIHLT